MTTTTTTTMTTTTIQTTITTIKVRENRGKTGGFTFENNLHYNKSYTLTPPQEKTLW